MSAPLITRRKRIDLDGQEHKDLIGWACDRINHGCEVKREIERIGLAAHKHYGSWVNPKKQTFPVWSYDPVFFGSLQGSMAKTMEAVFASPPIFDYQPASSSTDDQALAATQVASYHLRRIRPRRTIYDGTLSLKQVGTQVWHTFWDYQERKVGYWKRVPKEVTYIDPVTGMPATTWVDDGASKWVRATKIVRDSFNFKPIHITQLLLDDSSGPDEQQAEFMGFRDVLSREEAESRVRTDDWDPEALKRALEGDIPNYANKKITETMDWLQEIGMATNLATNALFDRPDEDGKKSRRAVEVVELYRMRKGMVWRMVVLNRSYIAWWGPSKFGHGRYPFRVSRNYSMLGQFWGLSDYQITRYLIRGVQILRNAELSQAANDAMPPLLIADGTQIVGKRWEPGAEWTVVGSKAGLESLKFFEGSGRAVNIAAGAAQSLIQQFGGALGTSEQARGGTGDPDQTASAIQLAFQAAGLRDKLQIENLTDDFTVPMATDSLELMQQFQDYSVQVRLSNRKGATPITVYPEDFQDAELFAVETASTTALRFLREKRLQDIYGMCKQYQLTYVDEEALMKALLEMQLPTEADRYILSPEEQAERAAAMAAQQGMQVAPGQAPGAAGADVPDGLGVAEMAGQLREAMAVQ